MANPANADEARRPNASRPAQNRFHGKSDSQDQYVVVGGSFEPRFDWDLFGGYPQQHNPYSQ